MLSTANHHRLLVVDDDKLNLTAGIDQGNDDLSSAKDFAEQWRSDDNFSIVSQTDLLKFIWDRRYKLGVSKQDIDSIFQQTPSQAISELANKKHPVDEQDPNQSSLKTKLLVKVPETSTAIAAFRKMWHHRASAVAVVDSNGAIIANLSASDLRGITSQTIETLLLPVYQFLELSGRQSKHQMSADQLRTATPIHSLGTVIEMMLTSRIHRVWIVDEKDKPIGVKKNPPLIHFSTT
jgi:CBS domain-containing protein